MEERKRGKGYDDGLTAVGKELTDVGVSATTQTKKKTRSIKIPEPLQLEKRQHHRKMLIERRDSSAHSRDTGTRGEKKNDRLGLGRSAKRRLSEGEKLQSTSLEKGTALYLE